MVDQSNKLYVASLSYPRTPRVRYVGGGHLGGLFGAVVQGRVSPLAPLAVFLVKPAVLFNSVI